MSYKVEIYRTARLALKGRYAFANHDPEGVYPYAMYVWIIRGEGGTYLVDTGPKDIDIINKGLAELCVEPVTRADGEDLPGILARAGLQPGDIDAVFLTHGHYDHVSNLDLFPSIPIVVNRRGWERARENPGPWPGEVYFPLLREWSDRLLLVEDETPYPGIHTMWVGGHTLCSQAIAVDTAQGTVVISGDVVSLYENMDRDEPIGVYEDLEQVRRGVAKVRERADIVLPSHDPLALDRRHPDGVVG